MIYGWGVLAAPLFHPVFSQKGGVYFFIFGVYHGVKNVITIPRKLAQKGDLVVLPREEYEALVRKQPRYIRVVELTALERRAIARSEKELARGEYVMSEELEHELASTRGKMRS